MGPEARELFALMKAVVDRPDDEALRRVFADWLEEHDEPELAEPHRKFSAEKYRAEKRLREFADRYAGGDYQGVVEGLLAGEYCFSDDDGPSEARDNHQLWDDVRIVTGEEIDESHVESSRFYCAC